MIRGALVAALSRRSSWLGLGTAPAAAQQRELDCQRCHGELELLRQHVATLDRPGRSLVRVADRSGASAHGGAGLRASATPATRRFPTRASRRHGNCASCHEEVAAAWERGRPLREGGRRGGEVRGLPRHARCGARRPRSRWRQALRGHERAVRGVPRDAAAAGTIPPPGHVGVLPRATTPHAIQPPEDPGSLDGAAKPAAGLWGVPRLGGHDLGERRPCAGAAGGAITCDTAARSRPTLHRVPRRAPGSRVRETSARSRRRWTGALQLPRGGGADLLRLLPRQGGAAGIGGGGHLLRTATARTASSRRRTRAPGWRSRTWWRRAAPATSTRGRRSCSTTPTRTRWTGSGIRRSSSRSWFMNSLLIGTLVVFGLHTVLWWIRTTHRQRRGVDTAARPRGRSAVSDTGARARQHGSHGHGCGRSAGLGAAGPGPFIWRFNTFHRWTHAFAILSFYTLILTGIPLRFSCAPFAAPLMRFWGGVERAGLIHRSAAALHGRCTRSRTSSTWR